MKRVKQEDSIQTRTVSCLSQRHPIVSPGLRRLTEDAWPTSMKELVTRSSSSMGIPPHPTCGANIMPRCEGLGRLIACDLIGMGRSDKIPESGPERYSYHEQRDYLFALWDPILETM